MNLEFAKHTNAVRLLSSSINFSMGFYGRAFHDAVSDYLEVALGRESDEWHDDLRHQVVDVLSGTPTMIGMMALRPTKIDLLQTSCNVYDSNHAHGSSLNNSVGRAATMVHEGWHAWRSEHDLSSPYDHGHATQLGKDYYYYHHKGDYPPGHLWIEKAGHGRSHSVFQVQREFLCDVADFGSSDVTYNNGAAQLTREVAARLANASVNFANQPIPIAYECGSSELLAGPRPSTPPPPACANPARATCGTPGAAQCIGICGDDSCCYVIH